MVHQKGESIFDNLSLIQDRNDSELCHYLQKALKQSDRLVKSSHKSPNNLSPIKSRVIQNQLIAILHRIESDENHKGIGELFEFLQNHQQISLDPYLEKYPDSFQNLVKDGLLSIQAENGLKNGSAKKETNGSYIVSNASASPRKRTAYTRVPTPKNPEEAINWIKTAVGALGLDANKCIDSEALSQINSNEAINTIEAAERAVQKAQETLNRFKKAYASNGSNGAHT